MSPTAPTETTERRAGDEPLPGYVLIEPLGKGGFGEVWKCVAPGGLHKAVKFVPAGGDQFRQEAAAFERVRAIRHAFLLTLERVESVGGDLVMVMELADAQLQDRFDECRRAGHRGIPRDELLRGLSDAAEALDVIGTKYGLQHLDVKPANLFLIDGHVKVGDYGLVRAPGGGQVAGGVTPKYAAPEVLRGHADARSDQYSLALVYYELLTGSFPYPGRTAQQLMLQHVGTAPDLAALAPADRAAVARALAKAPADRFPSCTAFVRALMASGTDPGPGAPPDPAPAPAEAAPATEHLLGGTLVAPQPEPDRLPPVALAPTLRGRPARALDLTPAEFVEAVVAAARDAAEPPPADGTRSCRFLCSTPAALLPGKLAEVSRRFALSVEAPEPDLVLLRRAVYGAQWGASRAAEGELWVAVRRAEVGPDTAASAGLTGELSDAVRRATLPAVPGVLVAVRGALENVRERRAHPRYPAGFPVRVHPVRPDGSIGPGEDGLCEDVSAGGALVLTRATVPGERVYLEFRTVEGVAGYALLAAVARAARDRDGHLTACQFRA